MINWKIHPRAVAANVTYLNDEDKTVAFERVDRPTQKTVEDAVEWAKGKLPKNSEWTHIRACKRLGAFFFADGNPDGNKWDSSDFICTREQFEAYVKEQDDEKWTHTIDGLRVRFLVDGPDDAGEVPVVGDDGYYHLFDADQLKPIKPKLSKSEAWDLCQDYDGHKNMKAYMYDLHDEYDII
ncbi:hypothetical protein [Alteromonas phage XX1924]|nr:hypothetical protein [Alteromonas phage XX1924]